MGNHDAEPDVGRAFINRGLRFLLDDYLPKIERCLEQLTDDQVWWRPNDESNSIGNLILHLCGNARQWVVAGLGDTADKRVRHEEFAHREVISRQGLLDQLRMTLNEVARILTRLPSTTLSERRTIQGRNVEVLEAVFHVTEHFSMHTGQIIMLTKILTHKDLEFYDLSSGVPVGRWRGKDGSS